MVGVEKKPSIESLRAKVASVQAGFPGDPQPQTPVWDEIRAWLELTLKLTETVKPKPGDIEAIQRAIDVLVKASAKAAAAAATPGGRTQG